MAETLDPAIAALAICTPARGFTDADRDEIAALAAEISKRDFDCGIAKQPPGTVRSLIAIAEREREAEHARKAAAPEWKPEVLKLKLAARNTFSKRAVAEGNPAMKRAAFVKEFGLDAYTAEMARWGCTADVRVPGKNPDKGNKSLKKALRALDPIEEATDFNVMMGRKVAPPVKPKGKSGDSKSENPYRWPEDHPGRLAAIAKVMGRMPTKFVAELAKAANCSISGTPLTPKV